MASPVADCSERTDRFPLLIGVQEVARLLGRSERSIWRDVDEGRMPPPIHLGGARRWRRAEIHNWVAAGCPDQHAWQAMRERRDASGSR